jgi:hypothetical protein
MGGGGLEVGSQVLLCTPPFSIHLLQEFDKKYTPTWHCIVGRNFGSYVTHETKHCAFPPMRAGAVAPAVFALRLSPPPPPRTHTPIGHSCRVPCTNACVRVCLCGLPCARQSFTSTSARWPSCCSSPAEPELSLSCLVQAGARRRGGGWRRPLPAAHGCRAEAALVCPPRTRPNLAHRPCPVCIHVK